MFTQITVFKLAKPIERPSNLLDPLEAKYFTPLGQSTQSMSVGFVPPRGENESIMETIGGQHILKVAIETKAVPAHVIKDKTAERVKAIEEATGRKPGKKERTEIKEDVLLSLLPAAFPKRSDVPVWIDTERGLLVIGSASTSKVDHVAMALVQASPDIQLQFLSTTKTPRFCMAQWLLAETPDDWPDNLNIERECVLKSDAEGATVKFSKHHLAINEVKDHIRQGKLPTQLALSWDGKVSFVLTEAMTLKKVQYLDGVMDESGTDQNEDRFDADVALSTGLLGPLLDDLIYALGGEFADSEGGAA
jgi:recombination associated protein RdgC